MNNLATVQAIYEAFGRGDVPGILAHFSENVAWDQDAPDHGVSIFEPGTGKAHAERFFAKLQGLEFLKFQPTNFLSGGNQIGVVFDVEVRIKANGKTIKVLEVHLWTFGADGKVTRFFHCVDRHAFVLAYQP